MAACKSEIAATQCMRFSAAAAGCAVDRFRRDKSGCCPETRPRLPRATALREKPTVPNWRKTVSGGEMQARHARSVFHRPLRYQKIIGRKICARACRAAASSVAFDRVVRIAWRLFHQQARQTGIRAFLDVAVQQLLDLLSQVCSVVKSRQFIALQCISGRREQKVPRRRGRMIAVQGALPGSARWTLPVMH